MFSQKCRWVQVIVILYSIDRIVSKVEFTNVKCTSLDPDFDDFEYCFLKSVNRSYKYLSLKVNLFKTPITKVKVNVGLLKRFSGYKPFLYNFTVDACRFLRHPETNPIANYFHASFRDHSNMNHTCPFDHDIIVEKLPINFINQHVTEVLPFPIGDYLLNQTG